VCVWKGRNGGEIASESTLACVCVNFVKNKAKLKGLNKYIIK
jgi:hypothetical protein